MSAGTFALSWGAYGGFYVERGYCFRIALGWVAVTFIPDVEVDDLMLAYVEKSENAAQR